MKFKLFLYKNINFLGGDQRERARERAAKKQAQTKKKPENIPGKSTQSRMERFFFFLKKNIYFFF